MASLHGWRVFALVIRVRGSWGSQVGGACSRDEEAWSLLAAPSLSCPTVPARTARFGLNPRLSKQHIEPPHESGEKLAATNSVSSGADLRVTRAIHRAWMELPPIAELQCVRFCRRCRDALGLTELCLVRGRRGGLPAGCRGSHGTPARSSRHTYPTGILAQMEGFRPFEQVLPPSSSFRNPQADS